MDSLNHELVESDIHMSVASSEISKNSREIRVAKYVELKKRK